MEWSLRSQNLQSTTRQIRDLFLTLIVVHQIHHWDRVMTILLYLLEEELDRVCKWNWSKFLKSSLTMTFNQKLVQAPFRRERIICSNSVPKKMKIPRNAGFERSKRRLRCLCKMEISAHFSTPSSNYASWNNKLRHKKPKAKKWACSMSGRAMK